MIRFADTVFLYLLFFFSPDQHNSELFSVIYLLKCNFANTSSALCVRQESKGSTASTSGNCVRNALCNRNRHLIFYILLN